MKKISKTAAATTALFSGMVLGINSNKSVHADTVSSSPVQTVSNGEQSANVAAAQTQLSKANNAVNTAQSKVDQQQNVVNGAANNLTSAQKILKDKQTEEQNANDLVKQATAQGIQNAKEQVDEQQQTVQKAQSSMNDLKKQLANAQTKENAAQQKVDEATSKRDLNQQAVDAAKDNLTNAENVLNDSDQAKQEAIQKLTNAKSEVDNTTNSINEQNNTIKQIQNQKERLQSGLIKTQQDAVAAKQQLASSQASAQNAQSALTKAQNEVNATQHQIDNLNNQLNNINKIELPTGYAKALTNYMLGSYFPSDEEREKLSDAIETTIYNNPNNFSGYKSNKADQAVKVDVNNLDEQTVKNLSIFAASVINQVRSDFSKDIDQAHFKTKSVMVTPNSVKAMMKLIREGYNEANWDAFGEGKSHNLNYLDKFHGYSGENMSSRGCKGIATLDDLKATIYYSIEDYLFRDAGSAWGHAENILYGETTMGASLDKYGWNHIDFFDDYNETDKYYTENPYEIPDSAKLTSQLSEAKSSLAATTTARDKAQMAYNAAINDENNTQQKLTEVENNIKKQSATLNNLEAELKNASGKKDDLQVQLNNAQKAVLQAQTNLDLFNASVPTKKANVKQAQEKLTEAIKTLEPAQADLDSALGALSQAKNDVATKTKALNAQQQLLNQAQEKLVTLKQKLTDLQNAPQKLAEAQKGVEKAQLAVENAKVDLEKAQQHLSALKQELVAVQEKQKIQQTAYDKITKEAIRRQGIIKYVDAQRETLARIANRATANLTDWRIKENSLGLAKGGSDSVSQDKPAEQVALPQTGNSNPTAVVALGVLASMFGLSLTRMRERKS